MATIKNRARAPDAIPHEVPSWILSTLSWTGHVITLQGIFFFLSLCISCYDHDFTLINLVGLPSELVVTGTGNAWAQVAVVFGMHSYADWHVGRTMVKRAKEHGSSIEHAGLPPIVTVWNQTRFVISLLWGITFSKGYIELTGLKIANFAEWGWWSQVLCVVLGVDVFIIRPLATIAQRHLNDICPPERRQIERETCGMGPVERFCRGVFTYEAILSGVSGAAYMLLPAHFMNNYMFYGVADNDLVLWAFSQFGLLVMTFGLYQQSAEIDSNNMMVLWWLILDFVWMYFFYISVGELTPTGEWNIMCHLGLWADLTLAMARTVILLIRIFKKESDASKKDA